MSITAYVPCFNGVKHLEVLLGALAAQTRRPDEIMVVDDGSADGSVELARGLGAVVIEHGHNRGVAAARNTALAAARGELLLGLDVDAIPAPDYVERVGRAFAEDPGLAAVCGQLIEAHSVLLPDRWRQVHMAQHYGQSEAENPRICFGSVTTARKTVLAEVGGWNETYRTNHEDVDLTQRMRRAGLRWKYDPKCIARHQRRDSARSVLSGFWNWHAPRGRGAGHFDSLERLIAHRIGQVTWGIFGHRVQKDLDEARPHLIGLTFLLPWWMTLHDLAEVPGGAATARALLDRFGETVSGLGASSYVAGRASMELSALWDRLFPRGDSQKEEVHDGFVAVFESTARRYLPTEPLRWAQIEFSLRRVELEERLEKSWKNGSRVLLANPPWYTPDRQGVRAGSRWSFTMDRRGNRPVPRYVPFPFFLAQAAERLNNRSWPNGIVDAIAEGLTYDEFHERATGYDPSTVVMETSAASFANDRRILKRLRADLPKARLILAGPHATARRREILETAPEVDLILIGEYERTLCESLELLECDGDLRALSGVAFRDGEGIVDTGRPEPTPFDDVGQADRLRLPLYNYRDTFGNLREPVVQLMATRGCPYECSFCQWPHVYYERRTIQRRDVESVFYEVRDMVTRYGFPTVYFDDDMFSPGAGWIERFVELIHAHDLHFEWGIMSRADTFRAEQWKAMVGAGLRAVKFGVESGDQRLIDDVGKRLKLDTLRRTMRVCRELGIRVHLTFTVGLPGESRETLARTRELILELRPDTLQVSRAMPLPGTALEDWAVEKGVMKTRDPSALDGFLLSVLQYPSLSGEEMDRFIEQTYAQYRAAMTDEQSPSVSKAAAAAPEPELAAAT